MLAPTSETFTAICPGCPATLRIPARARGKAVRCLKCETSFVVPADDAATATSVFDFSNPPAHPSERVPQADRRERKARATESRASVVPLDSAQVRRIGYVVGAVVLVAASVFAGLLLTSRKPAQSQEVAEGGPALPLPRVPVPPASKPTFSPQVREMGEAILASAATTPPAVIDPEPKKVPDPPVPDPPPAVPQPPPPTPPKPRDQKKAPDGVKQSVALIQGKYGHGSGFLIQPDVVVTNSHVIRIELMENVTLRFATNDVIADKGVKAKLLYEDKGRDLVFLRLDQAQKRPTLPLAKDFKTEGRPDVFVIGNPGQLDAGRSLANVVEPAKCDEDVQLIREKSFYRLTYNAGVGDIRIGRGNSGGPAVNDRGEVIGVVTLADFRKDGRPDGKAYCIPVGSIQEALESLGDPEGWAKKIDQATAHHARDIAVICDYVNVQIAVLIIEVRYGVRQLGLKGGNFVNVFEAIDKNLQERSRPASDIALASKELTAEQKQRLRDLKEKLRQLRGIAKIPGGISEHNLKWALGSEKRCEKLFDKFCQETGMSDRIVNLMMLEILSDAGITIDD